MKLTFHGRPCMRLVPLVLLLIASALSQTDSAYSGGRAYPYSVERVNRALQELGKKKRRAPWVRRMGRSPPYGDSNRK